MQEVFNALRRDGVATLPFRFDDDKMVKLWASLWAKPVWNAHVKAKATEMPMLCELALGAKKWPAFSHDMKDVVSAPFFFEVALMLLPFADLYLGESARLYSMNCFWTQPADDRYEDTHDWHRDEDDRKQLVLFMYGTSILWPTNGAHQYQRGTHLLSNDQLGRAPNRPDHRNIAKILGPAGTMFLSDTRGLHMGQRPNRPRMLLWARFGVSERPVSYEWDKLEPVKLSDERRALLTDKTRRAVELVAC